MFYYRNSIMRFCMDFWLEWVNPGWHLTHNPRFMHLSFCCSFHRSSKEMTEPEEKLAFKIFLGNFICYYGRNSYRFLDILETRLTRFSHFLIITHKCRDLSGQSRFESKKKITIWIPFYILFIYMYIVYKRLGFQIKNHKFLWGS